jgi:hypothetical protein
MVESRRYKWGAQRVGRNHAGIMHASFAFASLTCIEVDLPCPHNGQPWGASLGSPFPLLAQEVLEILHQLLRVEVFFT